MGQLNITWCARRLPGTILSSWNPQHRDELPCHRIPGDIILTDFAHDLLANERRRIRALERAHHTFGLTCAVERHLRNTEELLHTGDQRLSEEYVIEGFSSRAVLIRQAATPGVRAIEAKNRPGAALGELALLQNSSQNCLMPMSLKKASRSEGEVVSASSAPQMERDERRVLSNLSRTMHPPAAMRCCLAPSSIRFTASTYVCCSIRFMSALSPISFTHSGNLRWK
mmetsp:Transcript_2210/g.6974  ORF Transcript_2210/g.6974 Transcript_2210/m.6974 type:complete len:227 (+) Transcript_2210:677-1357(+)